jgi:aminopeptidase N
MRCLNTLASWMLLLHALAPGQDRSVLQKAESMHHIALSIASAREADQSIDVTFYRLNLTITTAPAGIIGNVSVCARAVEPLLDSMRLDLADTMTVDSVFAAGLPAQFVHEGDELRIRLDRAYAAGEIISVDVFYRGLPVETGFGSFVFSSHNGTPWVWSLSQPFGARDWWPCKDHPLDKADSVDIRITCDSSFRVGSNGRLAGLLDNGNGTRTWVWTERHPIAAYLVSIALTNYSQFTNWFRYSPADSMPVLNFVTPEHLNDGLANLPRAVEALGIFSERFGLYPFIDEKYGHAEFQRGGAMEHQTMTSATYLAFAEYVVAHELAHQWFGDMITCASWRHLWLNEGFATFCESIYFEDRYGSQAYWSDIIPKLASAKTATGTLLVQDTSQISTLFDRALVYDKGASVLHMLRHVLGDSVFYAAMKRYATTPRLRFATAVTADFQAACEETSGRDLSWFFQEWIQGENYPRYTYTWSALPPPAVALRITQTTGTTNPAFFRMPVDVRFSSATRETTLVLENISDDQEWTVSLPFTPTAVDLDPDHWILADISMTVVVEEGSVPVPGTLALKQNYPNPFNGRTVLAYTRVSGGTERVTLRICDLLGREVARPVDAVQPPGSYDVPFDGTGLPSGMYMCELRSGPVRSSRKMLLLR